MDWEVSSNQRQMHTHAARESRQSSNHRRPNIELGTPSVVAPPTTPAAVASSRGVAFGLTFSCARVFQCGWPVINMSTGLQGCCCNKVKALRLRAPDLVFTTVDPF